MMLSRVNLTGRRPEPHGFRAIVAVAAVQVLVLSAVSIAQAKPQGYEGYQILRISVPDKVERDALWAMEDVGRDFQIWSVDPSAGVVEVRVSPAQKRSLDTRGFKYEVLVNDLQQRIDDLFLGAAVEDFFETYRTYEEYVAFMVDLVATYPTLASLHDLGQSWEGRTLWALRISGPGDDKPGVMFHGGQHGNEILGPCVIAYMARHLLSNYGTDPIVRAAVDSTEWFLLPVMNPDGYERLTRWNVHGYDLNRDWGRPGEPGTGFSQRETAAMRDFFLAHPNVCAHIDFHSYGRMILWPWGHTEELCPDHDQYSLWVETMSDRIFDVHGSSYNRLGPAYSTLYEIVGGSIDYTYGELGVWGYVFELGFQHMPSPSAIIPTSEDMVPAMMFLSQSARSCSGFGDDDLNDTLVTATSTGLVGVGTVTVGRAFIGNGGFPDRDVDVYALEIDEPSAPVLVTIEVDANVPLDAYLRLFNVLGDELAYNDDATAGESNPRIATYLLEAGAYYVGVTSAGNPYYDKTVAGSGRMGTQGSYALTITAEAISLPSSPFEPNETSIDATSVGSESFVITGEVIGDGEHGRRDVDTYRLSLTSPARLDVTVEAAAIGSVLDPVVRLRNCASGIPEPSLADPCGLGVSDDSPAGSVDSFVTVGIPQAADVYLMVSGADNRSYDPGAPGSGELGSVGSYKLIVDVTYLDGGGPDEPNDSIVSAVPLPPFAEGTPETIEIEGFLGDGLYALTRGDRDFFYISVLDESKTLTVDVLSPPGSDFDPIVTVFDKTGRRIGTSDSAGESSGASIVLPVIYMPPSARQGPVYVMVMGTRQRFPNDPFVPWPNEHRFEEFAAGDGPGSTGAYRLTISLASELSLCGEEPNDTLATATPTGIVDEGISTCSGGLLGDAHCDDPAKDADLWGFQVVDVPVLLRGSLSRCGGEFGRSDFGVGLFNEEGTLVAQRNIHGLEEDAESYIFEFALNAPGQYFVGLIAGPIELLDPMAACSISAQLETDYRLVLTLTKNAVDLAGTKGWKTTQTIGSQLGGLFATRLDEATGRIETIDPATGDVLTGFPTPQPVLNGSEGLASDGAKLYFVGVGRYPKLYELDASSGIVLEEYILWQGSGYYSDAAMLRGELYLLDFFDRSLHVIDPLAARSVRTLPVGSINGLTMSGGLAALAGSERLYVADAFNTGEVYEIDPQTGMRTNTLPPPAQRPTALAGMGNALLFVADWLSNTLEVVSRTGTKIDEFALNTPIGAMAGSESADFFGDFDGDGDVDLIDYGDFQLCFRQDTSVATECEAGKLNRSGLVDHLDFSTFPAVYTGPLALNP